MLCCYTACFLHTHTHIQCLTFHWDRPEQWATGLFTADDSLFVLSSETLYETETKTRVCVCELLSRRNRAVVVYYVFIYVFHPLIDTRRRRRRRLRHTYTFTRTTYIVANISATVRSHFKRRRRLLAFGKLTDLSALCTVLFSAGEMETGPFCTGSTVLTEF